MKQLRFSYVGTAKGLREALRAAIREQEKQEKTA